VNVPDENPSGLGAFEFPMRFPGQYFDKETNLAYNVMRDYSAETGRYVQSDPIGLYGGPNTYAYTFDPLTQIDPFGLMGRGPGPQGKQGYPKRSSPCGTGALRGPEFEFYDACVEHDKCFDTCGRSKGSCDDDFCSAVKNRCSPSDFSCKAAAAFYCSVLQSTPSWVAYDPAQKAACACKPK
jgi:RHS repeat-associated protein